MSEFIPVALAGVPAVVAKAGERAGIRFFEFFASTIRNPHTRRAYGRAVTDFLGLQAQSVRDRGSPPLQR